MQTVLADSPCREYRTPRHPQMSDLREEKMTCDKATLWSRIESVTPSCLAELMGTAIYTFISCLVSAGARSSGILPDAHLGMIVPISLCSGFTVAALMTGFGKISGGHFNPAVTVAVYIAGGCSRLHALMYVPVQLLGGILGSALAMLVEPDRMLAAVEDGVYVELHVNPARAILCEGVLTMFVVITVLLTTVNEASKVHGGPVAVGFAYVVGVLSGIRTTGASMNPGRNFGTAVILGFYSVNAWDYHYVFWVGPIAAGAFAGLLYRFVLFRRTSPLATTESYKYIELKSVPNANSYT